MNRDNKEIMKYLQNIVEANKMRDSLENLYLYLHEIERMIQSGEEPSSDPNIHDEFRYKLQIMEQKIAVIDEEIRNMKSEEQKPENIS